MQNAASLSTSDGHLDSISLDTIFLSNAPNELDEPTGDGFPIMEPNENDVLLGRGRYINALCLTD